MERKRRESEIGRLLLLLMAGSLIGVPLASRFRNACAGQRTAVVPSVGSSCSDVGALPFAVGERLRFRVRYGMVTAGSAEMAITGLSEIRGHRCFRAVTTIESNALFSRFYRVQDYLESHLDCDAIIPWFFEKHLREGKYRADVRAEYDHAAGVAVVNGDTVRIPPGAQDMLSIFYFVRTQPMEVGKVIEVANHDNKKVAILELHVLRKEKVETEAGRFDAFVVEPRLKESGEKAGLLRQKGEGWIWFSADSRRLPVLIRTKMYFGSLTLELAEISRLTGFASSTADAKEGSDGR